MPNEHPYGAVPKRVWRIAESHAELRGDDFGDPGPLAEQDRLGDFTMPQQGIYYADAAMAFSPSGDVPPCGAADTVA